MHEGAWLLMFFKKVFFGSICVKSQLHMGRFKLFHRKDVLKPPKSFLAIFWIASVFSLSQILAESKLCPLPPEVFGRHN